MVVLNNAGYVLEFVILWEIGENTDMCPLYLQELQEHLKVTTFRDLVIRDRELTGALIASLINCYIRDHAAVDGISLHLQDICPLLYSTDDAICSKVKCMYQAI